MYYFAPDGNVFVDANYFLQNVEQVLNYLNQSPQKPGVTHFKWTQEQHIRFAIVAHALGVSSVTPKQL